MSRGIIMPALALGLVSTCAWAGPSAGDRAVATAAERVARRSSDDALVELASAFMRKARETGDPAYHERASAALARADASRLPVLRARAWVLLGRHRFRDALRAARAAIRADPGDWRSWGNLADACVELGRYRSAERATARMMDLRPGAPSYARVAALRSLFGDRRGAIDALETALAAADAADPEERAWLLTYLGHEHWGLGHVESAGARYEAALAVFPDYHLALPGLARVSAAQGRTDEAIVLCERALARTPSPSLAGALGDLHARRGDPIAARAAYDFGMYMGRVAAARGQSLGRELALHLADRNGDLDEALALLRAENRDDVYTNDATARVLLARGELVPAKRAMARALRLGTEEAAFHRHAAAIAAALGRPRHAMRHDAAARALEPAFRGASA